MKPLYVFIRDLREDNDLTQTQVGQALGISQQQYSQYENGVYEFPIRHLIGLAKLYDLNTDYILGLTEYKYSADKLKMPYLNDVTTGKLLSDAIALNPDGRKALIEYLEFLNKKYN